MRDPRRTELPLAGADRPGGDAPPGPGPPERTRRIEASDPHYPAPLRDLRPPPPAVFVRGALPAGAAVAIVGSRAATPYGVRQAHVLAADLARLGVVVVSGLARGIDAAAHRGALEAGGRTVAVLPGGVDHVTPRHHAALAADIAAHGALLAEFAAVPPWAGGFVRRNRLIAALGAVTVVVEAATRSGALSTAAAARRLGRPVLAVPGDVDRETSRGCHALLRAGARLCESAADVLAACGGRWAAPAGDPEALLLAALEGVPRGLDALAARAGLTPERALAALLRLEWAGALRALPGQRWARADQA